MERVSALPGRGEALGDSSGGPKEVTARLRRLRARLWPLSIRQYLVLLFLSIAVPLSALAFLATDEVARADRSASRSALMASTRALEATIDAEISRHRLLAEQLGQSRSLLNGDLVEFWREAKNASALLPGTWIAVVDPAGQMLVHTLKEPGDALPASANSELVKKVFLTRQHQLSDLYVGAATGRMIATLDVPVFRDGTPAYVISIVLDPARFQDLLKEQHFPEGWLTALIDRRGRFIARQPWGSADIGTSASEGWRAAIRQSPEGSTESRIAIEGYRLVSAYSQTDDGWTVGVGVKASVLDAPRFAVQRWLALAAGFCIVLSGVLGWLASRKLVRQTDQLLRTAGRLAQEKQIDRQSSGIREYDLVQSSFAETSAILRARNEERRQADEHRQLLLDELNHRVRNTLTAVQAIAMQTFRGKAEPEADRAFQARLIALSGAHDILTREHWDGADLRDIVMQATAPHHGDGSRIRIAGPNIRLLPKSALALAMALHELCTNAVKYGALKGDQGWVSIEWQATNTEAPSAFCGQPSRPRLRLRWEESGGPPVREPTKHGFGSRLLRSLSEDLDAQVELHYPSAGVVCTIDSTLARPR